MPTPKWKIQKQVRLQQIIKNLIVELGYDIKGDHYKDTPKRVAKLFYEELYVHKKSPTNMFKAFRGKHNQMLTMVGHQTWTRCPHHFERVALNVSIAYIPDKHILGLSKPARIADYFARGLELQEDITENIADGLMEALRPKGVAVYIEGKHLCACARGVESSSMTVTTVVRGVFEEKVSTKMEFLHIIGGSKNAKTAI